MQNIADGLVSKLNASGIAVEITALHKCGAMQGVETSTTTSEYMTAFPNECREQFREKIR